MFGSLQQVTAGIKRLAQLTMGASHVAQAAVPALLADTVENRQWKHDMRTTLGHQAHALCRALADTPGLKLLTSPAGAMYILVQIDMDAFDRSSIMTGTNDDTPWTDVEWSQALLREENVFVLPGSCVGAPHALRLVYGAPVSILEEAGRRVQAFAHRHYRKQNENESYTSTDSSPSA
jgi:tyrosine aminotransferase